MLARVLLLALTSACLYAADVTGTWFFTVDLSAGSGAPTIELKQEGTKLTGKYSGTLGDVPLIGKLDGDSIELVGNAEYSGEKLRLTYVGKLTSPTTMEGKAIYGELGEGKFTGKEK
jgi:hypothetical protein